MAAASREVHKQPFTKGTTATESKGQQYERKRKKLDIETEGVATTAPCHALRAAGGASPLKG